MDKSVPAGAALLLDFIAEHESRGRYDVVYGEHQTSLKTPITGWTLATLLMSQEIWGRTWGSSAAGRYQIMPDTLRGLMKGLGLSDQNIFSPDLQDRLAYALLARRGYNRYIAGVITYVDFGKLLAEEWASLPVLASTQGAHIELKRGQSYYESDGLNHALVAPEKVEAVLAQVAHAPTTVTPLPKPVIPAKVKPVGAVVTGAGAVVAGTVVAVKNNLSWPLIVAVGVAIALVSVVAYAFFKGKPK